MTTKKSSGSAAANVGESAGKSAGPSETATSTIGAGNPRAGDGVTATEVNTGEARGDLDSDAAANADAAAAGKVTAGGVGADASQDAQDKGAVKSKPLPKYTINKTVSALQIARIVHKPNPDESGASSQGSYGAILSFEGDYPDGHVESDFITKNNPQVGGYVVVAENGDLSYAKSDAFDADYKASK